MKLFDLNIEEVLEDWQAFHAIREFIANALDEQALTDTDPIKIFKDDRGQWHIRDFGRGLRIEHFTMKENPEKIAAPEGVIGKFGVGLKDALATLHRRGIQVAIHSAFGVFGLTEARKGSFDSITTLHVEWHDQGFPFVGTDVTIVGARDSDFDIAKSLFLCFSREALIEETSLGMILSRFGGAARVFINGLCVSEEPNFLFSYNITRTTPAMREQLNRERQNVGRALYSDRIKSMLKNAHSEPVQRALMDEVTKRASGDQCDEMQWIDVNQHALNIFHQSRESEYQREQERLATNPFLRPNPDIKRVAYLTESEIQTQTASVDNLQRDNVEIVVVTEVQKRKLDIQVQSGGPEILTLQTFQQEYNASFQYQFVERADLSRAEKAVWDMADQILEQAGLGKASLPTIKISETIRESEDLDGVCARQINAIVIKRSVLADLQRFAGVLLHEAAHARSGAPDATRAFETALTNYLGTVSVKSLGR